MDIVTASLSLYLLFPIISERQQHYADLIKRNITSDPEVIEKRIELVKFLGFDGNDYNFDDLQFTPDDESDETVNESVAEKYFTDTKNKLKLYEYEDEKFYVGEMEGERSSVISKNAEIVSRVKYDSSFRMIEEIDWKVASNVADSLMLSRKNWYYTENNIFMTEENFKENTFSDIVYDSEKVPVKISLYSVEKQNSDVEKNDSEEKSEKRNLSKISYYEYDGEKRVVSDKEEFYEQKKNDTTGRIKDVIVYTHEKKYFYTENSKTPDVKYYEDGKLRLETQMLDDDSYYESVFFSGGNAVRSKIVDGMKVEEKFFLYKE